MKRGRSARGTRNPGQNPGLPLAADVALMIVDAQAKCALSPSYCEKYRELE